VNKILSGELRVS